MPTFVTSAMNPNGTWQSDAMDASDQANRQAAFQNAQMQNQIAAQQLQAALERQRMSQQGTQFEEGRADQLGLHNSTMANENRMQQNEFAHSDNAALARADVERDIANMQFGPNSLASRQWQQAHDDNMALQNRIFGSGLASAASTAAPAAQVAGDGMQKIGYNTTPPAAAAPTPGGADRDMLMKIAMYNAVKNGTAIPDFAAQDMQHQAGALALQQAQRGDATQRIQTALDAGDIQTARQLSAQSGAQMPRVDAATVASRPDVQLKLAALDTLADRATKFAGDDGAVAALKQAMTDATTTLSNHGVNPAEADALVKQRVLSKIPSRYGSVGGVINDILSSMAVVPSFNNEGYQNDRVNALHDFIGQ